MKTLLPCFCLGLVVCALSTLAQSVVSSGSGQGDSEYAIIERGAHHQVWQSVVRETNALGRA
ncbi:MAG: hypothetical protein KIS67_27405, partial [Verrucomicrobiae bacterium]|nr:hypothetical protein [Verrucomicrobiae bacterium]